MLSCVESLSHVVNSSDSGSVAIVPIIFITGHGDEGMRIRAMRGGAVEFLAKPFDDEVLLKTVRAVLER